MYVTMEGSLSLRYTRQDDSIVTAPAAPSPADVEDIRHVLQGNEDAYARLVHRYQSKIVEYMWKFTRDENNCRELVQDVFVEAYLSLRTYRQEAPFLHWLRRIATRVGYRHWKAKAREKARSQVELHEDRLQLPEAAEHKEMQWQREFIHVVLNLLPPRDRVILTLLYLEGMSTKEASEALGWSHALVRVQAFRARKKLKAAATRLLEDERHE